MEGEAVKGKNEKQWKRVRPPAREKPFTAPAPHRSRPSPPPAVAFRHRARLDLKNTAPPPIRRKRDKRQCAARCGRTFATIRLPAPDKMYAVATR